jgi:hypothetical protein
MALINAEAAKAFPGLGATKAFNAFMATPRGHELHTAYLDAPVPVVTKTASSETKAAVFGKLVDLGREIAKREGIPESVAFVKVLETEEGKVLHGQYEAASSDPEVVTKTEPSSEPYVVLGDAINHEINALAKSESIPLDEASRRFTKTERGALMYRGYRRARGLSA